MRGFLCATKKLVFEALVFNTTRHIARHENRMGVYETHKFGWDGLGWIKPVHESMQHMLNLRELGQG